MWGDDNGGGRPNRRTLLRGAALAATAAAAGVGITSLSSDSAGASATLTGITASDVSVSSGDGTISELTIDPNLTIDWGGFADPVARIEVQLGAAITGNNTVNRLEFPQSSPATSGSFTPSIPEQNVLTTNGGTVDPADLADSTEGDGAETTDVTFYVSVFFYNADNTTMDVNGTDWLTESVTVTVSVTNEAASASVSGDLNTSGA